MRRALIVLLVALMLGLAGVGLNYALAKLVLLVLTLLVYVTS